jgi:4-hydroxy-tetrahydrodipicolinate reductase
MTITVVVTGVSGKMAKETLLALCRAADLEPVGAVSRHAQEEFLALPDGSGLIPLSQDVEALLHRLRPDVMVDFTNAGYGFAAARAAIAQGVRPVIGTSGLSQSDVADLSRRCDEARLGGLFAANFALGAVVLMHLAAVAARFFNHAEILEMHHDAKADAPSGTAIATAELMAGARGRAFDMAPTLKETLPHPRGSAHHGIPLHSMRLPGLLAHQEVVFGSAGQTLRLRHDTLNRECYMPGVLIGVREVMKLDHLVVGLDRLLGLSA